MASEDKWLIKEGDLDLEQSNITELDPNKTKGFIVKGSAGSGKTLLALHKARELQELNDGGTIYFVVLTISLKSFLKDAIKELKLDKVRVYHEWEFKSVVLATIHYMIVDEIQDFDSDTIKNFQNKTKKALMLFGDGAQLIYDNGTEMKDIENLTELPSYALKNNYRLTQSIAKFAQHILPADKRDLGMVDRCKKEGDLPIVKFCNNSEEEMAYIIKEIEEGLSSVAILLSNNDLVKQVYDYLNDNGHTAEVKMSVNNHTINTLNFSTNNPKIMTYHSSKGLEFKNVFLPFCNTGGDNLNYRRALYVAMTRASSQLTISYNLTQKLSEYIGNVPTNLYKHIK